LEVDVSETTEAPRLLTTHDDGIRAAVREIDAYRDEITKARTVVGDVLHDPSGRMVDALRAADDALFRVSKRVAALARDPDDMPF
jgi:hypothetical protein